MIFKFIFFQVKMLGFRWKIFSPNSELSLKLGHDIYCVLEWKKMTASKHYLLSMFIEAWGMDM